MFGKRTTSGAHVWVRENRAYKWAWNRTIRQRVKDQAQFIKDRAYSSLPTVYGIGPLGYSMEVLEQPSYERFKELENEIVVTLQRDFWSQRRGNVPSVGLQAHREYVLSRAAAHANHVIPDISVLNLVAGQLMLNIEACDIHGDPTFDNTMIRPSTKQIVLIDPLPPYAHGQMPSVFHVDMGKVLQSLFGYELIKYAGATPPPNRGYIAQFLSTMDDEDAFLCLYFCAVHFLRLLPYQPIERRNDYWVLLERAITEAKGYSSDVRL